jgi:hypothetical protein
MQSIGFKEWALVCAALGEGRQTIIIRKGGIAEGREGFAFRHREFFLFPTFFHEQLGRTRLPDAALPEPRSGEIEIRFLAKVEETRVITDWEEARALEPLHILQESVVRERFEYDDAPGVHVAFVRVLRLEPVWRFPDAKSYGGCRSWVELPEPPPGLQLHLVPVEPAVT